MVLGNKNNFFFSAMLVSLMAFCLCFISCGPSAAEIAIRSAPSVDAVNGLRDKLIWLQANAQSGGNYILEIDADEVVRCRFLSSCYELSYKDKNNITIVLRGIGANRTLGFVMHSPNSYGKVVGHSGFSIGSGVTLVLDNITLMGGAQESALVRVYSGGTLVMNDGSVITKSTNNHNYPNDPKIHGAGVIIDDEGTFIMKGGTIYGNTIRPRPLTAQELQVAKAGYTAGYAIGRSLIGDKKAIEKAEKKADEKFSVINARVGGAGVYVSGGVSEVKKEAALLTPSFISNLSNKSSVPSGTFIKTGGVITGYSSDRENGNVIMDIDGNVLNGFGHAVSFGTPTYASKDKEPITIDTTIGPEYAFNFSNGVFRIIQPENNYQESSIKNSPEIQDAAQKVSQKTSVMQPEALQEVLQEYQTAMQKIQATLQEAQLEYQATIQRNPAEQQEAAQKYQKIIQEGQFEYQKASQKYLEAMQKW